MAREITNITAQKKNQKRVNIYLNDEFGFGLSINTASGLEIGQVLSEDKICNLMAADEFEISLNRAVNYLSYRQRSEHEIRRNLRKHKIDNEIIERVINRLKENRLVDDNSFALSWVENRSAFKPKGRIVLKQELQMKGISSDIIENAIQHVNEEELAYQAAMKQSRKYQQLDWSGYRKKMISFLARRGFIYEVSKAIVEKTWREVHTEPENSH